jgi:hypothetical protein
VQLGYVVEDMNPSKQPGTKNLGRQESVLTPP